LIANRQKTESHCFDKALQADEDWLVPVEIALIYQHYGQNNNAMSRARLGIEREPAAPYAWYVLAQCQLQLGMNSGAKRSLESCLELKPDYRDAQNLMMAAGSGGGFWQKIKGLWSK
jgi:predicted Zn-dependent protease